MFIEDIIDQKNLSIEKANRYNAEVYAKALAKIIDLAQHYGLQICCNSKDGISVINTVAYNYLHRTIDPFAKCNVKDIDRTILYVIFDHGETKGYYLKDENQNVIHTWLANATEMYKSNKYIGFYTNYMDAEKALKEVPNGEIIKLEYNKEIDHLIAFDSSKI